MVFQGLRNVAELHKESIETLGIGLVCWLVLFCFVLFVCLFCLLVSLFVLLVYTKT